MPKYVVVFEQTFEPQMGVTLIDAESPEAAKESFLTQVPQGMGSDILVTNVLPSEATPTAEVVVEETPGTQTLALVE